MINGAYVDSIKTEFISFRNEKTTRNERIKFADDLVEHYFSQTEIRPSKQILSMLASLILLDEITDKNPYKTRNTEYPFLSNRQQKGRYSKERSFIWAVNYGTDKRNYTLPSRKNLQAAR